MFFTSEHSFFQLLFFCVYYNYVLLSLFITDVRHQASFLRGPGPSGVGSLRIWSSVNKQFAAILWSKSVWRPEPPSHRRPQFSEHPWIITLSLIQLKSFVHAPLQQNTCRCSSLSADSFLSFWLETGFSTMIHQDPHEPSATDLLSDQNLLFRDITENL